MLNPDKYLSVENLQVSFETPQGNYLAVDDVTFHIKKGEFVSIIGHSGCGKTTILHAIAGLSPVTRGGVLLEDREVTSPGPERAIVFQNHSLLPWLTVYENVRLAVDTVFARKKSPAERDEWTLHNLDLVHMLEAAHKKPGEISGGMKQRVGIARALSMEPKVLLMDEPFGALDALTRAHLQDTVMEIHARLGNTAVMITHDVEEAVLLSDRVIMMSNGPSATIADILTVGLARPRPRLELASNPEFNGYRSKLLKYLFETENRRNAPRTPAALLKPVAAPVVTTGTVEARG